ncbi:hypothetical protein KR044_005486 [Drosophila immigrans]|nr:hypothetical protein KR044_005486 [Drosophila immigrans]
MKNTKFNNHWTTFQVLILVGLASAVKYRFENANEEIFTPCVRQPSNVKDITDLFDFSEFQTNNDGEKLIVSGNLTSRWNYDPTDRIEGTATVYRFERREWVNTLFKISYKDLCTALFDKEKHWYKLWTKYLINAEEVKLNCFLNGVSSQLIHEPFELDLQAEVPVFVPSGVHKLEIVFKAINAEEKVRDPILCFEIIGESFKF